MDYSATEIATYLEENFDIGANFQVQLWTSHNSESGITHTTSSMMYRDDEHQPIMYFFTMDDGPEDFDNLVEMVEFQMENQS